MIVYVLCERKRGEEKKPKCCVRCGGDVVHGDGTKQTFLM